MTLLTIFDEDKMRGLGPDNLRALVFIRGSPNQGSRYNTFMAIPKKIGKLRYALKKKNDIIWEFFPNVGPPPPLLGTPYPKKFFSVYFAF